MSSAFKYFLTSHAEKLEKKKVQYACLARVVRSGGFWIALVVRYSAIPGHCECFLVHNTCNMQIIRRFSMQLRPQYSQ